jgi:hypothetical protein
MIDMRDDKAPAKGVEQKYLQPGNVLSLSVQVVSEQWRKTMHKSLAVIAATVALLSAASDLAVAGGSVSAPSKYAHANRVMSQQATRQAVRADYPITEYSSSSARNR